MSILIDETELRRMEWVAEHVDDDRGFRFQNQVDFRALVKEVRRLRDESKELRAKLVQNDLAEEPPPPVWSGTNTSQLSLVNGCTCTVIKCSDSTYVWQVFDGSRLEADTCRTRDEAKAAAVKYARRSR